MLGDPQTRPDHRATHSGVPIFIGDGKYLTSSRLSDPSLDTLKALDGNGPGTHRDRAAPPRPQERATPHSIPAGGGL